MHHTPIRSAVLVGYYLEIDSPYPLSKIITLERQKESPEDSKIADRGGGSGGSGG